MKRKRSRDETANSRPRDDQRRPPRDFEARRRDPRDVFMRDLDLPRGREREIAYDARDRTCQAGRTSAALRDDVRATWCVRRERLTNNPGRWT
jgi:hypothetical protein